jgi:hypothetical protein
MPYVAAIRKLFRLEAADPAQESVPEKKNAEREKEPSEGY